jgi:hypothetical protein
VNEQKTDHRATLICWHCRKERDVVLPHAPQFAFELAKWADDVGMLGVIDLAYGRALIFCDETCAKAERTKRGGYRFRPRGVRAAAQIGAAATGGRE